MLCWRTRQNGNSLKEMRGKCKILQLREIIFFPFWNLTCWLAVCLAWQAASVRLKDSIAIKWTSMQTFPNNSCNLVWTAFSSSKFCVSLEEKHHFNCLYTQRWRRKMSGKFGQDNIGHWASRSLIEGRRIFTAVSAVKCWKHGENIQYYSPYYKVNSQR